jgi:DNA-binding LacI/PurR family transcriptional regulator
MAMAGLGAAQRMGVRVPAGLSIVVWDDSTLCELVHPAFTALRRDIPAAGVQAARILREAVAGGRPDHFQETPPVLLVRDSTGHPPA